jgi:hypothetical protein
MAPIGASTDNSYLFDGTYRPAIRNYCTCYENNVGTLFVEQIVDSAPDDHLALDTSNYIKYLARIGNNNLGTLTTPLDDTMSQESFITGQATTTAIMLGQIANTLSLLGGNLVSQFLTG